jgi:hypothetical protein
VQILQTNYYGPSGNVSVKKTDMISDEIAFSDSSKRWLTFVKDNSSFSPRNWIRSGTYAPIDPIEGHWDYYSSPCYQDEVGIDDELNFSKLLEGGIAPHRLVGYHCSYTPLAYFNLSSPGSARTNASISFLPSVDIVLTSDKSKWTRCPVIELGKDASLNVGQCPPGALRKSPSVNKNGNPDGTGSGMGWFPGYAIDLESGARLYMAFGENSFLGAENGADMIWNPTDRLVSEISAPLMGGVQPFYVFSYKQKTINNFSQGFDFPEYIPAQADNNAGNFAYQKMLEVESNSATAKREFYGSLSWIAYPLLRPNQQLLSSDVTIKLRINKEYKNFTATGVNSGRPMYGWSMSNYRTVNNSDRALADALKLINVVPNPYNAFSEYENNKLDNRVKIINLPEKCTVRIYSTNGKLIREIKKDSPQTYIDWTLTNHANIPIASGVYLIHVDVPGIGERVLKSFVAMRMVDLQNM